MMYDASIAGRRCQTPVRAPAMECKITIRDAVAADAVVLAELHVRGWQWAYRGLLPAEYLDGLSVERRRELWQTILMRAAPEARTWVLEWGGRPVGFASIGPARDDDVAPETAELYALYLDEQAAGRGLGRALLAHAMAHLVARNYAAATLWVLASNARARRFYEAAGWRPDGGRRVEVLGSVDIPELRYRLDLGSP